MYPALQFWKTLVLSRHLKATPPPFHGYGWLANLLHAKKIIYVHYWFHKLTYIMLSWRYLRVVQLAWKSFPLINVSREYYLLLMTDTLYEHWWHTVTKLYWVHKLVEVLICHNNKVVVSNLSWEYCSLLITCVHSIYVVQLAWKSFPLINASWEYYLLLMTDTPHEHWWHTVTKLYWFINWLICHNKEVVSNLSWEHYCSLLITCVLLTSTAGSLMNLLQQVGTAYQCLHGYDLATSLRCFRSLPPRHRSSAWCLSHMARVYHSGERYREAAKLFREVHSIDPHRQDGVCKSDLLVLSRYFLIFGACDLCKSWRLCFLKYTLRVVILISPHCVDIRTIS